MRYLIDIVASLLVLAQYYADLHYFLTIFAWCLVLILFSIPYVVCCRSFPVYYPAI